MKRRDFVQKTIVSTVAVTGGATAGIMGQVTAKQKFNFMEESHPNIILIGEFFKAYAANNLADIRNILDKDIKWHIPGKHPLSGVKTSIDEVLDFFKKLGTAALKAEPIVMGVNDNYVIDCHRNWSTMEGEENLDSMSCLLWRIENNKIIEVHNFPQDQHIIDLFFSKVYG